MSAKKRLYGMVISVLAVGLLFFPQHVYAVESGNEITYVTARECAVLIEEQYARRGEECRVVADEPDRLISRDALNLVLESIENQPVLVDATTMGEGEVARVMPYSEVYSGVVGVTAVPGLAYASISCVVEATVNAQNGLLMTIDNAYSYCSVGFCVASWEQSSLNTSTIYKSGKQYIQAHLKGFASFSYAEPTTGLSVYRTIPVDHTFQWPTT